MARRLLIVGLVVIVLVAGGVWWFVLRDDAPPPAALQDCEGMANLPPIETDGRWAADTGDNLFLGYRIDEQFGGDTLSRTVVGRTPGVSGELVMDGGRLAEATIEGDLTGLASDEPRRDAYLGGHALETDDLPTATFTLTEPIDLPDEVASGQGVSVDAVGTLELHGVTKDVTVAVDACVDGTSIRVAGSTPIVLADYDIETPDIPGLVHVEDHGTMEFQLNFSPA